MLMKFCPRCKQMISADKPYCTTCQPLVEVQRQAAIVRYAKRANKKYDATKRDPKYRTFYCSQAWRRLSAYMIAKAEYQCQDCKAQGHITVASEVHHIQPIQTPEGWQRRLDENNLAVLCARCHNKRHKRFGARTPGDAKKYEAF